MLKVENKQQFNSIYVEQYSNQNIPDSPLIQHLQLLEEPPELSLPSLFEFNNNSRGPSSIANQNQDFWTHMKQLLNFEISFEKNEQNLQIFLPKIRKTFKHFEKSQKNINNKRLLKLQAKKKRFQII